MTILIPLLIFILSAWACFSIAKSRQGDAPFWLAMGVLFGPLAVPFAFLAKTRK